MNTYDFSPIKAIIGLGNPGNPYYHNRHNIGFRVVEELAKKYNGTFKKTDLMELAQIQIGDKPYLLIMPQTYMNSSGKVIPFLNKKGINANNILVIHDELELPFGTIKGKPGGSAKGHNGLKSIIQYIGQDFARLAIGIGRPTQKEDVPNYVLENFKDSAQVELIIQQAINLIENSL